MRYIGVLLAALTLVPAANGYIRLPALEQIASQTAGRSVEVRCPGDTEWAGDPLSGRAAGYVMWTNGVPQYMVLSPKVCFSLILLTVDPADTQGTKLNPWLTRRDQGEAMLVFAHEAMHMAGVYDEGMAECRALRHLSPLAHAFGVPEREVPVFVGYGYDAHALASPQYRTAC